MPKQYASAAAAIAEVVTDGATIAVGGFGLCGTPFDLIESLRDTAVRDLTIVSNNMGIDGKGLGLLIENDQVSKVIASYVGENRLFAEKYLAGELEVEFAPQGTLAERLRAGGAGIAAFYTRSGVGTVIAEGKPSTEFDGETHVLERAIVADVALVHAYRGDPAGNLTYHQTARNFNPIMATAGRITIAEVEIVVDDYLDPEHVITPGVFVDRIVPATARAPEIERRTVRPRPRRALKVGS